jgi:hypothetical protein
MMAAGRSAQAPPPAKPCATRRRRRPPRTALALVLDELHNLPVVDDRYRHWPWSLRALARRRGTSPGTVHKHVQALRATAVLVDDESQPGRLLVDTALLQDVRPLVAQPVNSSTGPAAAARPAADHLVRAIDSLSTAAEARPELVDELAEIIGRLAHLLVRIDVSPTVTARGRAPQAGDEARDRAPSSEDRKRDPSRSTAVSLSVRRARRAPTDRAREARGRASDRSAAQLFELLAPLDPARHVTYTEGVLAALAPYDDDQIRHAIVRAATSAATNPVGLLVDRATSQDPTYFPPVGSPQPVTTILHGSNCACGGAGVVPVECDPNTYRPCTDHLTRVAG